MDKPNEQVIFEKEDLRVSTITKINVPGTGQEMELEPGERIIIETFSRDGKSIYPMDFKRFYGGQVTCPYGITDAALAAILKYRLEQRLKRDGGGSADSMFYGEVIRYLKDIENE